jgi:Domain of unknown function (DUF3597)
MGIFDRLKNAILGTQLQAGPPPTAVPGQSSPPSTPAPQAGGATQRVNPAQSNASASASNPPPVDVEAVLKQKAATKSEKLNWESSIVDLMKLVDLDPSLENRKALATELGYSGSTQDSAAMNTWLHRQVMQQLAASGGKVPDRLRH